MLMKLGYKLRPFGPLARAFVSTKKLTFERCSLSIVIGFQGENDIALNFDSTL